jgi:NAD(P)-dependent dehydrogenase (short-subunit alcohol dehydrogenase family)
MEHWEKHFSIHLKAPALLGANIARQREVARGLIVNMIDQRVWALTPNFYSYTLSKSALWTATQTMAQEFAPKIRVNAIGPGPALPNERQSEADFDAQCKALILNHGPQLHEFGATIRYLYEMESITGQMIALDGGQHLAWATPDAVGVRE